MPHQNLLSVWNKYKNQCKKKIKPWIENRGGRIENIILYEICDNLAHKVW